MTQNEPNAQPEANPKASSDNLGDEILNILGENCKDPGQAFVLLQQLTIYVWDQYKIDWRSSDDHQVAPSRKQRYLDYAAQLIDALKTEHRLAQEVD
jgi:hypothetical protein